MLVGVHWGINAIRADETGSQPAYFMPTGQVTMFYGKHHGSDILELAAENVPRYRQPYGMGDIAPKQVQVSCIDALATADDYQIRFHAINRSFDEDLEISVDLSGFTGLGETAVHHLFEGRLRDGPAESEPREKGFFRENRVSRQGTTLPLTLPKRSVSIVEIPRTMGE